MHSHLSAYAQVNNSRRSAIHHASLSLLRAHAGAARQRLGAARVASQCAIAAALESTPSLE
jgi:hypothetical protein